MIPTSFLRTHGDKAWYGFTGCLVEFRSCMNDLRYHISEDDLNAARQVIHQMLGISGLIEDEILLERLMIVQAYVKEDNGIDQTLHAMDDLASRLSVNENEVIGHRPPASLLLLSDHRFSKDFVADLQGLHCLESVATLSDTDQLADFVDDHLPDILLIIKDAVDKYELKKIGRIRKQYLGTKILYFDRSRHAVSYLKRFIRLSCKSI